MTIGGLLTDTCQVLNQVAGQPDPYGNTTTVDGDPVTVACRVSPLSTTERLAQRDTTAQLLKLYLPEGTAITAASRVVYGGKTWDVLGAPFLHRSPAGGLSFVSAVLQLVEGG